MKRVIAATVITLSLLGSMATSASAAKTKNCGTTTTQTGPGNSGFTQTQTETQTAACGSNSDQGEVVTTGPVTNRGGGTPGGQQ